MVLERLAKVVLEALLQITAAMSGLVVVVVVHPPQDRQPLALQSVEQVEQVLRHQLLEPQLQELVVVVVLLDITKLELVELAVVGEA